MELTKKEKDELYLNNVHRRSFQWEFWALCNQKCKFCYLGDCNNITTEHKQLESIEMFNKALDNLDFSEYNNVSVIGGEFFQGEFRSEKVKEEFLNSMKRLGQLYLDKKIGSVWITCTLTRTKQDGLLELLNYFEDNGMFIPEPEYGASGLWLCTSWDCEGRFHSTMQRQTWEDWMLMLSRHYKWVKKNTTIILTEPFMEACISGEWNYKEFSERFKTTCFFKQSGAPDSLSIKTLENPDVNKEFTELFMKDEEHAQDYSYMFNEKNLFFRKEINNMIGFTMFPRRKVALKFLKYVHDTDREWFDRLCNIKYRADELHRNFKEDICDAKFDRDKHNLNEEIGCDEFKILPCGHNHVGACYCDYDTKCIFCDKMMVEESEG